MFSKVFESIKSVFHLPKGTLKVYVLVHDNNRKLFMSKF